MAVLNSNPGGKKSGHASAQERSAKLAIWRRLLRAQASRIVALSLVVAGGLAGGVPRATAQAPPSEYEIKAAFLYNFAKFIDWPADAFSDPHAPIVLGIVGEDPFGAALDRMVFGKSVNNRGLVVKRVWEGPGLRSCHILFISLSKQKHLARILESLKGSGVLTVGEMDRFAESGGAIHFLLEEDKVRFEINLDAATRARLKLSAKLLALARRIVADGVRGKD